jgi:hypothetical protein
MSMGGTVIDAAAAFTQGVKQQRRRQLRGQGVVRIPARSLGGRAGADGIRFVKLPGWHVIHTQLIHVCSP